MKVERWTLHPAKEGYNRSFDQIKARCLTLPLDRESTTQATEAGDATQPVNLSNARTQ
jgi:hypothetical protein